ncbi:MAG: putative sulfate exporter family transporter, partial [Selenomonadaceae bacterium]
ALSHTLGSFGKFAIIWAMSAIGLNTNLASLIKNGFKPILLGLVCWFAVAVVSLIVQHIIGLI